VLEVEPPRVQVRVEIKAAPFEPARARAADDTRRRRRHALTWTLELNGPCTVFSHLADRGAGEC
jgi:hypothetical protein